MHVASPTRIQIGVILIITAALLGSLVLSLRRQEQKLPDGWSVRGFQDV